MLSSGAADATQNWLGQYTALRHKICGDKAHNVVLMHSVLLQSLQVERERCLYPMSCIALHWIVHCLTFHIMALHSISILHPSRPSMLHHRPSTASPRTTNDVRSTRSTTADKSQTKANTWTRIPFLASIINGSKERYSCRPTKFFFP